MTYCFTSNFLYTVDPKLPKKILAEMYKQCKNLDFVSSETYDPTDPYTAKIRESSQHWLYWDHWIAGIMHNIFISANNDYFHYDLNHFDSGIQVTKYGVNNHYGWHTDMLPVNSKEDNSRKLSMSLLLNDDFEGGDLEIDNPLGKTESLTVDLKAGTCALFPSWIKHRVAPVTSGTRFSLVAWMNGPQFK